MRVGDTWTVTREMSSGPGGGRVTAEIVYKFEGWQERFERRCARLEFKGTLKPGSRARDKIIRNLSGTNAPVPPPDGEPGTIEGVTWFSPDLGLPVETVFDQTTTSKIVSNRRVPFVRGTNQPAGTNPPLAPAIAIASPPTNAPNPSYDITRRQHVDLKLVEVAPMPTLAGQQ